MMHGQTKINNNKPHFTYHFPSHISSPFAVFTSSSPSPVPSCLWTADGCPAPVDVFPTVGRSECSYALSAISYFYDLEKPQDILRLKPNFAAHRDRTFKKTHKNRDCPGKAGSNGSPVYVTYSALIFTLECMRCIQFVSVPQLPRALFTFFKIRVSVALNSKSQCCLHAVEHASAFPHSHTLHHLADGINICVADGAGVEGYVQ